MACDAPIPPGTTFGFENDPHLRRFDRSGNTMGVPVGVVQGSANAPGIFLVVQENTGVVFPSVSTGGFTFQGQLAFLATLQGLEIWIAGQRGTLTHANTEDRTWTFPDESGVVALEASIGTFLAENKDVVTIQKGQPVTVHSSGSGVVLARANNPTTVAIGIAAAQIAVGATDYIMVAGGVIERSDWTSVIGAVNLSIKTDYFLSAGAVGILTSVAPSVNPNIVQFCGLALSTTELLVRVSDPIYL